VWRVTDVTVDDNAAPMSTDSLSLPLDVCRLIKKGRHLRLEQRPHHGVTVEDAGVYDSFEDARAWAYHQVQQQVPEQERRHYYGLLTVPTLALWRSCLPDHRRPAHRETSRLTYNSPTCSASIG